MLYAFCLCQTTVVELELASLVQTGVAPFDLEQEGTLQCLHVNCVPSSSMPLNVRERTSMMYSSAAQTSSTLSFLFGCVFFLEKRNFDEKK